MNAIVSVTNDWGIGLKGQLIVRNKADMRRFRELTMGGAVVMGRATFESFPGGALKGRRNIVLTSRRDWAAEGAEVAHSAEEALRLVSKEEPATVWLIGGASLYEQLLPHCYRAYVTRNACAREADAFFPNLDESGSWTVESREDGGTTDEGVKFEYVTYVHRPSRPARKAISPLLSRKTSGGV